MYIIQYFCDIMQTKSQEVAKNEIIKEIMENREEILKGRN